MKAALLICLCLFQPGPVPLLLAQHISIYDCPYCWEYPESVSPEGSDLFFNDPGSSNFTSRSFYFTGRTLEGYMYIINIFHWRYFGFDGWGMAIMLSDFYGNQFIYEGKIHQRALLAAEDRFSIRFADNSFEDEEQGLRICLSLEGFRCDLKIFNILPPWIPGDGFAYLNKDSSIYMRKAVPIPLARTSGMMVVAGEHTSAEGWCYGDRSLTVMPPWKMDFTCGAFRVFSDPSSEDGPPWLLALLHYMPSGKQEGGDIPMLLLARGDRWIFTTKDYRITFHEYMRAERLPYYYPRRMGLSAYSRGYSLEGDFQCHRLVAINDVFIKLPSPLRAIATLLFKRPVMFRMIGYFEGTLTGPDGSVERMQLAGQGDYMSFW